jgi:hypothetical protein
MQLIIKPQIKRYLNKFSGSSSDKKFKTGLNSIRKKYADINHQTPFEIGKKDLT